MRHRILTCKHHPELRWSCKDVAWSGCYNGSRNIFFCGSPTGKGMFDDGSGLDCSAVQRDDADDVPGVVRECQCPANDLILAPEDALVKE